MTTPPLPTDPAVRQATLVDHFDRHRDQFTVEALRASALDSGYAADEIETAIRLASEREAHRQSIGPVRKHARNFVLIAYGVVWVLFAAAYLGPATTYGYGVIAQAILTASLGVGLAISLAIIARGRPDPAQPSRAMVILLVVPVVLLLGVAGLCLPFVGTT